MFWEYVVLVMGMVIIYLLYREGKNDNFAISLLELQSRVNSNKKDLLDIQREYPIK